MTNEMTDSELADEVLRLTLAWQQGQADEDERGRLEFLLSDSSRARDCYVAAVRDTVALSDEAGAQCGGNPSGLHTTENREALEEEGSPLACDIEACDINAQKRNPQHSAVSSPQLKFGGGAWQAGWVAACAAAILVAFAVSPFIGHRKNDSKNSDTSLANLDTVQEKSATNADGPDIFSYVARVVRMSSDVKWPAGSDPSEFLLRIKVGQRLEVTAGSVELEFYSGANIILQGPAVFTPMGPSAATLAVGRVTGNVDRGDFKLMTPAAEVIDLGTKFGVTVDHQSNTEVCVFSGKVSVRSLLAERSRQPLLLTKGMAVQVAFDGKIDSSAQIDRGVFLRNIPAPEHFDPSPGVLSLVDIISGGEGRGPRMAGAIDPVSGRWDQSPFPFTELSVVAGKPTRKHNDWVLHRLSQKSSGQYHACVASSVIDGVFVPSSDGRGVVINSAGDVVNLPPSDGDTWGPIWARRDTVGFPLAADMDDFWGTDTLPGIRQRLSNAAYGIVGIHPNVGITFDLRSLRMLEGLPAAAFQAVLANLDNAEDHDFVRQKSKRRSADFRIYVDRELRFERLDFARSDGDAEVDIPLFEEDRFLTLIATDAGNHKRFDHLVLIDSVFRLEGM